MALSLVIGASPALRAQSVSVTGGGNAVTLAWGKAPGNTTFRIDRRELALDARGMIQPLTAYRTVATIGGSSYQELLPTPSLIYEYQVSAVTSNGQVTAWTPVRYSAPPFTTVTDLVIAGTAGQASLRWTAASGVSGYQVWRRTVRTDGTIAALGLQTPQLLLATGFTDPTLVAGELYEYQVISVSPDGTTWPTAWIRHAPSAPPVLALGGAGDRVALDWTPTAGATGYQVARYVLDPSGRRSGGGTITPSPIPADELVDMLPAPALYEYQVMAMLPDGSSVASNAVSYPAPAFATPVGVAATAIGLRGVVTWNPALGVTGYQVWRRTIDMSGRVMATAQVATLGAGGAVWIDTLTDPKNAVEYQVIGLAKDGRAWPSPWVRGR